MREEPTENTQATDGSEPTTAVARPQMGGARLGRGDAYTAIGNTLQASLERLRDAVPRAVSLSPEHQIRVALTALRGSPGLLECTPASIVACVFRATQLGLEIGEDILGHTWMIPRRQKGGRKEAVFQLGVRGLIELVCRSGRIEHVAARSVREGDHLSIEEGGAPELRHVPSHKRGEITHCYARAHYRSGLIVWSDVWDRERIKRHLQLHSHAPEALITAHWEAFAHRTMITQLCKYLPKGTTGAAADACGPASGAVAGAGIAVAGAGMAVRASVMQADAGDDVDEDGVVYDPGGAG